MTVCALNDMLPQGRSWRALDATDTSVCCRAWMLDLAKGRAQLNVILCAINVVLAITFVRLAREVCLSDSSAVQALASVRAVSCLPRTRRR
jgi:hypothetical protein